MNNQIKMKNKCIGIVGMPLSGKDTAGEYLSKKYDFITINMHSIVKEEVKKRNLKETRENYQMVGTELRKKEGNSTIAERICKDWIPYIEMNVYRTFEARCKKTNLDGLKYVIMGIRNYEEVDFFREIFNEGFILIAILSSQKIRFDRTLKRKRKGFDTNTSYEKFLKQDIYEISELNLGSSIALADYYIVNNKSIQDLYKNIDKIISTI